MEEFKERTDFYAAAGYRVIWLFDLRREFSESQIHKEIWNGDSYLWSYVKKPFRNVDIGSINAKIFVQLIDDNGANACIEYVNAASIGFKEFWTDNARKQTSMSFIQLVKAGEIDSVYLHNGITRDSEIDNCEENDGSSRQSSEMSSLQDSDLEDNEPKQTFIFPPKPNNPPAPDGKTVWQLWDSSYQSMVVQNTINMDKLLIQGDAGLIRTDWQGRALGTYTKDRCDGSRFIYTYSQKEYVVKDARSPIWKLIYAKKRTITKPDPLKQWFEGDKIETRPENMAIPSINDSSFGGRSPLEQMKVNVFKEPRVHTETREEKYARHLKEVVAKIDQQNIAVYDTDGGRWVKCQICGKTKPASDFIVYGGEGSINLGECKQCFYR